MQFQQACLYLIFFRSNTDSFRRNYGRFSNFEKKLSQVLILPNVEILFCP